MVFRGHVCGPSKRERQDPHPGPLPAGDEWEDGLPEDMSVDRASANARTLTPALSRRERESESDFRLMGVAQTKNVVSASALTSSRGWLRWL